MSRQAVGCRSVAAYQLVLDLRLWPFGKPARTNADNEDGWASGRPKDNQSVFTCFREPKTVNKLNETTAPPTRSIQQVP
jgi:hypothetical protein